MLAAGTDVEGSAGYVAIERVIGTLHSYSGTFALQHIAFVIKGLKEKVAYLDAKGIPLVQRGDYTGGRYA